MLGLAVCETLSAAGFEVITVGRENAMVAFEVGRDKPESLPLAEVGFIINCIGLISHLIDERDPISLFKAASLNALFPHELANYARLKAIKVIQIATDCVFSGKSGGYLESSEHDASDIYGVTKSIGEVNTQNVMNIRASIIGREKRGFRSLLEWVLSQPLDSEVSGYTDRLWNGVTTLAFARVVTGVIREGLFRPGTHHLVPRDKVTKAELVQMIAEAFYRQDIKINKSVSGVRKDLTLETSDPAFNLALWRSGGYIQIPTIGSLIGELSNDPSLI
jgi:dTDP-4-dehydrorhamnose reductase